MAGDAGHNRGKALYGQVPGAAGFTMISKPLATRTYPSSVSALAIWHASRSCQLRIADQEKVVAKGLSAPVVW